MDGYTILYISGLCLGAIITIVLDTLAESIKRNRIEKERAKFFDKLYTETKIEHYKYLRRILDEYDCVLKEIKKGD